MTSRFHPRNSNSQIIQALCRQVVQTSSLFSLCKMPRFPVKAPRASERSMMEKGVTRFWRGMVDCFIMGWSRFRTLEVGGLGRLGWIDEEV